MKRDISDAMENKKKLLSLTFKKTYEKCEKSTIPDDRQLFVNCFDSLMRATEEMKAICPDSPIIRVGFNNEWQKEFKELERQEKSLKERNMI